MKAQTRIYMRIPSQYLPIYLPISLKCTRKRWFFAYENYEAFVGVNNEGEARWMNFVSTFLPQSIEACPKRLTYKWRVFLRSQGVLVDNGRETPPVEALK